MYLTMCYSKGKPFEPLGGSGDTTGFRSIGPPLGPVFGIPASALIPSRYLSTN